MWIFFAFLSALTNATVADELTCDRTPHVSEAFWRFALCYGCQTTHQIASYVCQWAWLLLRLCCMIGAFHTICSMTFWTWMKWMFVFFSWTCLMPMTLMETQCFFFHSWPTEIRCSIKNPTLVDASLAALSISHTDSGVVWFQVITALSAPVAAGSFQVWQHLYVLNEREVSLMLALQMCWCVLWDQWNGLVIFNQMSWQIYSPPLRGLLTLWRSTLAPLRSR